MKLLKRICLVVDDEPAIRTFLRESLERKGLQTLEAGTAVQALKIVQELNGRLDFIVSDINMPGDMDGVDLAHSVKNAFPDIPIILISGYEDDPVRIGGFQLLRKPFEPETILKAVRRVVHNKGEQPSNG